MKIQFVKDCGHHKAGDIEDPEHFAAAQYMVSGFAIMYVEPVPEPPAPKKAPAKKPAKAKAKKK